MELAEEEIVGFHNRLSEISLPVFWMSAADSRGSADRHSCDRERVGGRNRHALEVGRVRPNDRHMIDRRAENVATGCRAFGWSAPPRECPEAGDEKQWNKAHGVSEISDCLETPPNH